MARLLPEGGMLYSIEKNALNAAIATKICEFAGLQSKVKIIVGMYSGTEVVGKYIHAWTEEGGAMDYMRKMR